MKPRFVVRPRADLDLDDPAAYIARDSVPAAHRFYEAAARAFELLADMPGMGSSWESPDPKFADLRVWPIHGFEKNLIFYRIIAGGVEIVRVVHSARNVKDVFGSL